MNLEIILYYFLPWLLVNQQVPSSQQDPTAVTTTSAYNATAAAAAPEDVIQAEPEVPPRSNDGSASTAAVFDYGADAVEQYQTTRAMFGQPKERWHWAFNRIVQVGLNEKNLG